MQVTRAHVRELAAVAAGATVGDAACAATRVTAAAEFDPRLALAFEGVDELRRIVATPYSALTDAERGALRRIVEPVAALPYEQQPLMPFHATAAKLLRVADPPHRWDVELGRAAEHERVLHAWSARLAVNPTDRVGIAAQLDSILREDAVAVTGDPQRLAQLQTLLVLDRTTRLVPTELGFQSTDDVADVLGFDMSSRAGGTVATRFLQDLQQLVLPDRRSRLDAAIERALADGTPLPVGTSLDVVVSSASGWADRTRLERMRLLDALSGPAETPRAVTSLQSMPATVSPRTAPDIYEHLARQWDTVVAGGPWPAGATIHDLALSARWSERPGAQQFELYSRLVQPSGEPVLAALRRAIVKVGPEVLALARDQARPILVSAARGERALPAWVRIGDVLALPDSPEVRHRLLAPLLAAVKADSPAGAAVRIVDAQALLDGLDAPTLETMSPVVTRMRELITRNIARIDGVLRDGPPGEPDYGEIGRIIADTELLAAVRGARGTGREAAAAELLSW